MTAETDLEVVVEADQARWAYVPTVFPYADWDGADAWCDDVVERYTSTRGDASSQELSAARLIASHAVGALGPDAAFGMLFWPARGPLAVLVQFEVAGPNAVGDDLAVALLADLPLAHPPSVDEIDVPGVGAGIAARFLLTDPVTEPGGRTALAAVAYLIRGPRCSVRIMSAPTSSTMVGLLDAPLREVVATLRIRN